MTSQTDQPTTQQPQEFFDDASFKTLYGGVVVTWVATSAIVDVWDSLDPKMLGFIIAIIVAFVGFFMKEKRSMKKLLITPFNGLLIYLTIMGGTSFLPAPTPAEITDNSDPSVTESVEGVTRGKAKTTRQASAFFTSWNPDRNLIEEATRLKKENVQLQQTTNIYESKLDSTRQVIQNIQMSPEVRNNLMQSLDVSTQLNNVPTDLNQNP